MINKFYSQYLCWEIQRRRPLFTYYCHSLLLFSRLLLELIQFTQKVSFRKFCYYRYSIFITGNTIYWHVSVVSSYGTEDNFNKYTLNILYILVPVFFRIMILSAGSWSLRVEHVYIVFTYISHKLYIALINWILNAWNTL